MLRGYDEEEGVNINLWEERVSREQMAKLAKFITVGGSGVIVNSVALYLLHEHAGLQLIVASILAVELAVVNNFVWNDNWTFTPMQGIPLWNRFLRFNLISAGGLLITTGVLYALTQAGMYYLLANLMGISLATVWNFTLNTLVTWTS